MSTPIEISFLAVPKPPDPYENELFIPFRIAALKYRRKHPECCDDKWAKYRRAAQSYVARHPGCIAAPMTDKQVTNFLVNGKRLLCH